MLTPALALLAACGAGTLDAGSATEGIFVQGDDLQAIGTQGGTFGPDTTTYQILNLESSLVDWSITADQPWVDVTPGSGSIDALQSATVTVMLNSGVESLPVGTHTCTLSFANLTSSIGDTSRTVMVTATPVESLPMTTATRTTGVAPLAVVFDAVGAGTGVVQPQGADPDHSSFTYAWNYGDPTSGNWAHNGKPKNSSNTWIGAHVFESPGTYRVTLSVIDPQGSQFQYHQDITVSDPDQVFSGRTYYVSNTGNDANSGSLAAPFATPTRGIQQALADASPARVLLRRGDSFTSNSFSLGNKSTSLHLGAFGQGNPPRIEFPNENVGIYAGGTGDARICDIDLVSTSTTQATWAHAIAVGENTTVLRCSIQNFGKGISHNTTSNVTVAECAILNSTSLGLYAFGPDETSAVHLAILGNRFDECGQHLLRCYVSRTLIQSNLFQRSSVTAIKMCGRNEATPSRLNCIESNIIETDTAWVIEIGPENATSDQHVKHVMLSGNLFRNNGPAASSLIQVFSTNITIRNNIFALNGARAIGIERRGIGPMPHTVVVEHNTAYRHTGSPLTFLNATSGDSTLVTNNILYCRAGSTSTPTGTITLEANLQADPQFVDAAAGNLALGASSPALDAAVSQRVLTDFAGAPRPAGQAADIGALERQL